MLAATMQGSNFLAKRSEKARQPALPYFEAFSHAQKDLWTPDNPDGHVVFAVAENRLNNDILLERLGAVPPPSAAVLNYNDFRGTPELRAAVVGLLQRTCCRGCNLDPDDISVLAGAGSVLDCLFQLLVGPGDACLIPAPYYPAFDNDLQVRNSVFPIPAHLDLTRPLKPQLDAACDEAHRQGHNVRALLFTSPSNPLGCTYSAEQMRELLAWCLVRRCHCISDEIYANSVWGEGPAFVSMATVLAQAGGLPGIEFAQDLVHVIGGMSKDFGASGLRVGWVWSRNAELNRALGNISYFCGVGGHTQWMVTNVLNDAAWVEAFLTENNRRLKHSYTLLTGALDAAGIPYTPAWSAMFLWVDCRAALRQPGSWAEEAVLWRHMAEQHKVLLTPGSACHSAVPGFFRMCWAWMPPEALPLAVQRIAAAMADHKSRHAVAA